MLVVVVDAIISGVELVKEEWKKNQVVVEIL
jgi:hypothetical protein